MPQKTQPPKKETPKSVVEDDDEDEIDEEDADAALKNQFISFVKVNDQSNPGTHILLSQSDFWMRHAGVITGRKLTSTDTGICFFKFRKSKLDYNEYLEFLQLLADYKHISVDEIIEKLVNCGPPPEGTKNVMVSKA